MSRATSIARPAPVAAPVTVSSCVANRIGETGRGTLKGSASSHRPRRRQQELFVRGTGRPA
jgi:hypothetical protein